MGIPVSFTIEDDCVTANLGDFCRRFASALPPLVAYLSSPEFRSHSRWRGRMPFDVPGYGPAAVGPRALREARHHPDPGWSTGL